MAKSKKVAVDKNTAWTSLKELIQQYKWINEVITREDDKGNVVKLYATVHGVKANGNEVKEFMKALNTCEINYTVNVVYRCNEYPQTRTHRTEKVKEGEQMWKG